MLLHSKSAIFRYLQQLLLLKKKEESTHCTVYKIVLMVLVLVLCTAVCVGTATRTTETINITTYIQRIWYYFTKNIKVAITFFKGFICVPVSWLVPCGIFFSSFAA